jgi:PEP-CTERM motif
MKMFKKAVAGAAVAVAFTASAPAMASTVAISDLFINTLGLGSVTTAGFVPFGGTLSITNESRTGTAASNFNGVVGAGVGAGTLTLSGPVNLDVKNRCAGDCVGAAGLYAGMENNFTQHLTTPGTVNFAMGDMFIGGTALGGGTVQGLTRANAMTSGPTNQGGGNATILNSGRITGDFTVGTTFTGNVLVGADYWLQAFVDSVLPASGQASAGFGWNMSVTCSSNCGAGWTNLNFAPSSLNQTFSSFGLADNAGSVDFNSSYSALSDPRTFIEGTTYNFTINQSSNALVSEVPEPESLALVGLGLLGLALARRRKLV